MPCPVMWVHGWMSSVPFSSTVALVAAIVLIAAVNIPHLGLQTGECFGYAAESGAEGTGTNGPAMGIAGTPVPEAWSRPETEASGLRMLQRLLRALPGYASPGSAPQATLCRPDPTGTRRGAAGR